MSTTTRNTRSKPGSPPELRIGELAARTGRSLHTIRWYEAQGLLPGVIRDGGGRRTYREIHVRWLELMERLRLTGMTIAEMREYTALAKQGKTTLRERRELLLRHRQRVERTIAEWTTALRLIDGKLDYYGEWLATGTRPALSPSQRVPALRNRRPGARPRTQSA
jgi:DNA-binding transcriptional MerR regulator